jgi:hypothetical protein
MPLTMMRFAVSALALMSSALSASTFDNAAGRYQLTPLPDAAAEAERMDRMQLCDLQPAGRHARTGDSITMTVTGLRQDQTLDALVGFQPLWGSELDQQAMALEEGENILVADQDGPLYFRLTGARGGKPVTITVRGGQPLPLYVDGQMSTDDWQTELAAHARAPFVQLIGDQALITLPAKVYARHPIADPQASFAAINEVLDLENKLSGFDGGTALDQPSPLRTHFLVDFRASKKDRESFYMYATDQFVGMLDDNTTDLTNPDTLRREWGIWHETGHTQQQNSWTWEALAEVNVNIYSLYVQESLGEPSTLAKSEDGEPSYFDQARDYLQDGAANLLDEVDADDDGRGFFIRLVMFHQLKQAYGWDLYMDLNKHFRAHPLPADASDQDKADALVIALCELTGVDLRPFFGRWGLAVSAQANRKLDRQQLQPPDDDFSEIFE